MGEDSERSAHPPEVVALVVAAGRGARFGAGPPKQYRRLGGEPLLRHSLALFATHPAVARVRAVIHPDDRALYAAAAAGLPLLDPVAGGATRQESVRLGLESLAALAPAPGRVLIHDAARPLVAAETVSRVLAALAGEAGAIPAIPARDTLKRVEGGRVAATLAREGLWLAQTPQGFRFPEILAAHRRLAGEGGFTDDAAVAEAAGLAVAVVAGAAENIKVTDEEDLARAERILAACASLEVRTGLGFDVHRFGPGRMVRLCGIEIPFERALLGHSDADVGLHALTDAILGALAAGDIGSHFPPEEDAWRSADSAIFLRHAAGLVAGRGGRILNLDVTLVCERPRIGPHRRAMAERIAAIARVPADAVGVKATTTEGLGFAGRGEGIAAQAVATLALPPRR